MSRRTSIGWYADNILVKPLYPYQCEIGDAILDSVFNNKGLCFTVMLSRQMGKNQLSAVLEAYLLSCMESGTIIKCAPTFKPQVINSRMRLQSMLENPLTSNRVWKSFGYIYGVASAPSKVAAQDGPRILFFSAGPEANIVGATASLLLEVDEAQDVSVEKFNTDLRPMASTTNATCVVYGTAWSDETLLAQLQAQNEELEEKDGVKRHFQYDWTVLAKLNPNYKRFVETEIQRLGEDHLTIRTQYKLQTISGAGLLLNDHQRYLLRGTHKWMDKPDEDDEGYYMCGIDVGGEERPKQGEALKNNKRDSTVISLARVITNELSLPVLEIVHHYWLTGMTYANQYALIAGIIEMWNLRRIVIDSTGLGEALASLLIDRFGDERIIAFKFSRPSKSRLTYQFLNMINTGRFKMYSDGGAPDDIAIECWKQLKLAQYRVPGEGLLDMHCDPTESHDDFLISTALCTEAVKDWTPPIVDAAIVRPRGMYFGESRY